MTSHGLSEKVGLAAGEHVPHAGRYGPPGRRWRWSAVVAAVVVVLVVGGCTGGGSSSLSDRYPTLSIGAVSYPEAVTFADYFREVNVAGRVFELPFPAQDLVEAGWVFHDSTPSAYDGHIEDLDGPVMPFYSTRVTLVRADDPDAYEEGRSLTITLVNPTARPVSAKECEVWELYLDEGFGTEPYPGVHRGISLEELVEALGLPPGTAPRTESTPLVVFRERMSAQERSDLSGRTARGRVIRSALVTASIEDGVFTGGYGVRYAPYTAMTEGYIVTPHARGLPYRTDVARCPELEHTWLLPSDLSSAVTVAGGHQVLLAGWDLLPGALSRDGHIDGTATYSVDGHDYAMGATNEPSCHSLTQASPQEADQHVFAELDADLVGEPTKTLLWEGERSSAGMLVYRGPGPSTGQDSMQVVVNYCDWEHGTRLTFLYSLLSLEPEVEITDGAANLLLTVAADATRSITFTHQQP
ncbi:MAG: hypothetical protein FWH11_11500 [Micrococcales bacterium]|nr:hypothetical protein [Micrococcales bacterium]